MLISLGMWGWAQGEGASRIFYSLATPILAAALWGLFAVPDDPSRSGKAPMPVPGWTRIILELVLFSVAVLALYTLRYPVIAFVFALAVVGHYVWSFGRMVWLVKR